MQALVKVEGLTKFVKYLRTVGGKTLPKQVRVANLDVSEKIAAEVRSRSPVGKAQYDHGGGDKHPGKLKGSVKAQATQRMGHVIIGRGLLYAKPIIFGWPAHHLRKNPYPYDILDENRAEIAAAYWAALQKALEEAQV